MNKTQPRVTLYYALMAAVIGLFCLCIWLFPISNDDLLFMSYFGMRNYNPSNTGVDLWKGFLYLLDYTYHCHNIRLGNYIAALSLLLPQWVSSTVISACMIYMFKATTELAGIRPGQIGALTLLAFLFVFGLSWQDGMFAVMYAYNYIVSSAICCFMILFLLRGRGHVATYALLGLLMGLWHESFGTGLGAGIAVWCLCDRTPGWTKRLWMLGGLFAGCLVLISAPALWHRYDTFGCDSLHASMRYLYIFPALINALVVLVASASGKWRRWMRTQPIVLLSAGSLCLLILVPITSLDRSAFPAALLSTAALVRFAMQAVKTRCLPRPSVLATIPIWIFILAHLTAVAGYCAKLRQVEASILSQLSTPPTDTNTVVFVETAYLHENTWLTLRRPDYEFMYPSLRNAYGIEEYCETNPLIMPVSLKEFDPATATPVESNIPAWITDQGYVVVKDGDFSKGERANISYRHWQENTPIYRVPFYNDKGERWVYVAIYRTLVSTYMTDIRSIYF